MGKEKMGMGKNYRDEVQKDFRRIQGGLSQDDPMPFIFHKLHFLNSFASST